MSEFNQLFAQQFTQLLAIRNGGLEPALRRVVQQLVFSAQAQHSCIELADEPGVLAALATQKIVGKPGEHQPLVLHDTRLYLHKYWRYEHDVAAMVCARNHAVGDPDPGLLKARLDTEFGTDTGNRQKLAALLALTRNLLIVTGGPGTGKTSTVRRILALLREDTPDLEIRLAAPTGKAAMRLEAAISDGNDDLQVQTLHRLLGIRRDGRSWRHGPDNPVSADLVVIDEASMIDLPMMHRLLQALRPSTRLILLGDPHQLPSVDTGNVLADLCDTPPGFSEETARLAQNIAGPVTLTEIAHGLTDAVCELDRSYRFDDSSGVGQLAAGIRAGSGRMPADSDGSVSMLDPTDYSIRSLLAEFWSGYQQEIRAYIAGRRSREELLAAFEDYRVLCSRRGGEVGVEMLNTLVESQLEELGLKQAGKDFYAGRPVMITRNDYNLGLYNGDVGICIPMEDSDQYLALFPGNPDRIFLASRLPEHETCFAMTVHKAQGSEFAEVQLILGEETSDEAISLLNRELLYTAVTRAKQRLMIVSPTQRWEAAISRSATRVSGMSEFLRNPDQVTI